MAATATTKRASMSLTLKQGTDPITQKDVNKSVSISGLRGSADADKIYALATAVAPCVIGDVSAIAYTEVKSITAA